MLLHLCVISLVTFVWHEEFALAVVLHEPEVVEGKFGGSEVLMKTGTSGVQTTWRSVANLTADVRKYELEGVETSTTYTVTVRGRMLPNSFSDMADPLVFETMNADLSLPQNVKLEAVEPYTVRMTWDVPKKVYGLITGHIIE
ncbi:Oncosphere antigen A [Echinococcus granulosus]|uniref:Fibronectin type-III domain-containing protein n=1 Tax=Echinococcus granulosus TaxID=6210 RepID=A0A068X1H0_ECHGR|nr:Oncosphere antigen A [Echinococcus granulosus]CDS23772.1 hypothetical protein EgrG_002045600 [Echinococcus granulosus]